LRTLTFSIINFGSGFPDPKGDNFDCYKNAFAITPNLKEFENIVGCCKDHQEIILKAKNLLKTLMQLLLHSKKKNQILQ